MPDPFRPDPKAQLLREAQIGLTVVAVMLALFLYVAFYKITGRGRRLPDHVRNAPIANIVQSDPRSAQVSPSAGRLTPGATTPQVSPFRPDSPTGDESSSPSATASTTTSRFNPKPPPRKTATTQPSLIVAEKTTGESGLEPPRKPTASAREAKQTQLSGDISNSLNGLLGKFNSVKQGLTKNVKPNPKSASADANKPSKKNAYQVVDVEPFHNPKVISEASTTLPLKPGSTAVQPKQKEFAAEPKKDSLIQLTSAQSTEFPTRSDNQFAPSTRGTGSVTQLPRSRKAGPQSSSFQTGSGSSSFNPPQTSENGRVSNDVGSFPGLPASRPEPKPTKRSDPSIELPGRKKSFSSKPNVPFSPKQPKSSVVDVACPSLKPSLPLQQPESSFPLKTSSPDQIDIAKEAGNSSPMLKSPKRNEDKSNQEPEAKRSTPAHSDSAMSHVVAEGESFWSIAQDRYDDGRYFRALFEHNRIASPDLPFEVTAGTTLTTPDASDLERLWPKLCPVDSSSANASPATPEALSRPGYITESGDTLFRIARQKLGQASRYLEIKRLNRGILGAQVNSDTELPAGLRLALPTH